ncbi:restriction endonuclease [Paenibacillus sp. HW567]|uniref:restriction endonuclease n=1 Tax=Paenibacillus sp. HW567 TaxID=1034769 RepID=UPI00036664C2|nr:restriction endonuclease [Paenibacillus sp. HW567]
MIIPTKENFTEMSSSQFEQFVMFLLKKASDGLPNVVVQHDEIIETKEGSYQIDGTIRFELMGVEYLTLVECKMYKHAVSREKVQVLYDKLRIIGAHKGILATTSYFQSGAIEYASSHGIALLQIVDGKITYNVRSKEVNEIAYPPDLPQFIGIAQYKINDSSIGCTNISISEYLREFVLNCN